MKQNKSTTGIIGGIIILVTIALFFLITEERTNIDWYGFFFMLLGEAIAVAGFLTLPYEKNTYKPVYYSGISTILSLYASAAIIASLAFMTLLREYLTALISIQILMLAAAAILLIMVRHAAQRILTSTVEQSKTSSHMKNLANRVKNLSQQHDDSQVKQSLIKLYELLLYSDHSTLVSADHDISDGVSELEKKLRDDEVKPEELIKDLEDLMRLAETRKLQVQETKQGRI